MTLIFSAVFSATVLMAQTGSGADCVYEALPVAQRASIGETMLVKRSLSDADATGMVKAIDKCRPTSGWSVEGARHASGYVAMRSAADAVARRLGNPSWSASALRVIRALPAEKIEVLAKGSGDAEFKLVLTQMIAEDRGVATSLNGASDAAFTDFILMVKMAALAEVERRKI